MRLLKNPVIMEKPILLNLISKASKIGGISFVGSNKYFAFK
jgi:hypothetical protein